MKTIWKVLCAAAMVGMTVFSAKAEEKTITVGTMSWEDLTPITGITKKVLEDSGYTVKVVSFSEWGIAYAALSKGDIQLLASQTDYVAQDYWDKNKRRLEKISPVSHGLYQAIAVPKYVTIDSMDQLNDNADKFGGKIIGIEPGSGLMRDAGKAAKDYGLKLASARRRQHGRDDGRSEIGNRPQGMGRRDGLGTILDDAAIRRQVPQGSEGRFPAATELLLDRPERFLCRIPACT